ncbi:uncharacterized protein MONOS_4333 [Monocercomonoides exilis]|uniref:uncharacterized protein n=1 Tax=Monocercomonoides exilis TaxID=2049356 RepID=UPI003559E47F|nr:hypothetical protein MONOS_4333 [Monocercomonoides exilis]|eukprot:MONOS_4333.1-p1 / transcript=MONOS_4333.1 / gene=MONOS_4333 / organism=Monocercomonoides_exilis_PA203 / gene_product=unspecified product / transcript_product=unspecified product / location=Mono_scaffold00114:11791-17694(+) / protein_length=1851 / sequence_SO=supercontig / SO=protein_coding / is_pseudo=false
MLPEDLPHGASGYGGSVLTKCVRQVHVLECNFDMSSSEICGGSLSLESVRELLVVNQNTFSGCSTAFTGGALLLNLPSDLGEAKYSPLMHRSIFIMCSTNQKTSNTPSRFSGTKISKAYSQNGEGGAVAIDNATPTKCNLKECMFQKTTSENQGSLSLHGTCCDIVYHVSIIDTIKSLTSCFTLSTQQPTAVCYSSSLRSFSNSLFNYSSKFNEKYWQNEDEECKPDDDILSFGSTTKDFDFETGDVSSILCGSGKYLPCKYLSSLLDILPRVPLKWTFNMKNGKYTEPDKISVNELMIVINGMSPDETIIRTSDQFNMKVKSFITILKGEMRCSCTCFAHRTSGYPVLIRVQQGSSLSLSQTRIVNDELGTNLQYTFPILIVENSKVEAWKISIQDFQLFEHPFVSIVLSTTYPSQITFTNSNFSNITREDSEEEFHFRANNDKPQEHNNGNPSFLELTSSLTEQDLFKTMESEVSFDDCAFEKCGNRNSYSGGVVWFRLMSKHLLHVVNSSFHQCYASEINVTTSQIEKSSLMSCSVPMNCACHPEIPYSQFSSFAVEPVVGCGGVFFLDGTHGNCEFSFKFSDAMFKDCRAASGRDVFLVGNSLQYIEMSQFTFSKTPTNYDYVNSFVVQDQFLWPMGIDYLKIICVKYYYPFFISDQFGSIDWVTCGNQTQPCESLNYIKEKFKRFERRKFFIRVLSSVKHSEPFEISQDLTICDGEENLNKSFINFVNSDKSDSEEAQPYFFKTKKDLSFSFITFRFTEDIDSHIQTVIYALSNYLNLFSCSLSTEPNVKMGCSFLTSESGRVHLQQFFSHSWASATSPLFSCTDSIWQSQLLSVSNINLNGFPLFYFQYSKQSRMNASSAGQYLQNFIIFTECSFSGLISTKSIVTISAANAEQLYPRNSINISLNHHVTASEGDYRHYSKEEQDYKVSLFFVKSNVTDLQTGSDSSCICEVSKELAGQLVTSLNCNNISINQCHSQSKKGGIFSCKLSSCIGSAIFLQAPMLDDVAQPQHFRMEFNQSFEDDYLFRGCNESDSENAKSVDILPFIDVQRYENFFVSSSHPNANGSLLCGKTIDSPCNSFNAALKLASSRQTSLNVIGNVLVDEEIINTGTVIASAKSEYGFNSSLFSKRNCDTSDIAEVQQSTITIANVKTSNGLAVFSSFSFAECRSVTFLIKPSQQLVHDSLFYASNSELNFKACIFTMDGESLCNVCPISSSSSSVSAFGDSKFTASLGTPLRMHLFLVIMGRFLLENTAIRSMQFSASPIACYSSTTFIILMCEFTDITNINTTFFSVSSGMIEIGSDCLIDVEETMFQRVTRLDTEGPSIFDISAEASESARIDSVAFYDCVSATNTNKGSIGKFHKVRVVLMNSVFDEKPSANLHSLKYSFNKANGEIGADEQRNQFLLTSKNSSHFNSSIGFYSSPYSGEDSTVCEWASSLMDFTSSEVQTINVTFVNCRNGALSFKGGTIKLERVIFFNNSDMSSEWASIHRNVLCTGKAEVSLSVPETGDGSSSSPSLWMSEGDCNVTIPSNSPHNETLLFVPVVHSAKYRLLNDGSYEFTVNGTDLCPCQLFFFLSLKLLENNNTKKFSFTYFNSTKAAVAIVPKEDIDDLLRDQSISSLISETMNETSTSAGSSLFSSQSLSQSSSSSLYVPSSHFNSDNHSTLCTKHFLNRLCTVASTVTMPFFTSLCHCLSYFVKRPEVKAVPATPSMLYYPSFTIRIEYPGRPSLPTPPTTQLIDVIHENIAPKPENEPNNEKWIIIGGVCSAVFVIVFASVVITIITKRIRKKKKQILPDEQVPLSINSNTYDSFSQNYISVFALDANTSVSGLLVIPKDEQSPNIEE